MDFDSLRPKKRKSRSARAKRDRPRGFQSHFPRVRLRSLRRTESREKSNEAETGRGRSPSFLVHDNHSQQAIAIQKIVTKRLDILATHKSVITRINKAMKSLLKRIPPQEFLRKPHPLAYLYFAQSQIVGLKYQMKRYCSQIKQLVEEKEKYTNELFAKGTKRSRKKSLPSLIDQVDKEEKKERNGFQLLMHLQQLEKVLVQVHLAWTNKERLRIAKKVYMDNFWFDYEEESDDEERSFLMFMGMLEFQDTFEDDEEEVTAKYEKSIDEHEKISKKIAMYITRKKIADDWTMNYLISYYNPCAECLKLFNCKTLQVFGTLKGITTDDKSADYFCRECAGLKVSKDEDVAGEESDRTGAAVTATANTPTGNDSSNAVEQKSTSGKKRRKRKKKKKKKSIELSTPSSCTSEADGSESPASSTQPDPTVDINESKTESSEKPKADYLPPQVLTKPHPLALAYYSAVNPQGDQKKKMKESCLRVEKAKLLRNEANKKLFSKHTTKGAQKTGFGVLDSLDKEEEEERNGFHLLRCLQQLERSSVMCHWASTMKEKYSRLLEKFILFGVEDEWKKADNDSGEDEYLQVLHKEHKRIMGIFNQNSLAHKAISKEIVTYLTGLRASCKSTCRRVLDYAIDTYTPCAYCETFYNRAVAEIFGVVKVDDNGRYFICQVCESNGQDVSDDEADAGNTPTAIEQNVEPNDTSGKKRRKRKKKKSIDSSVPSRCLSEADGNELLPCSTQLSELNTSLEDEKSDSIDEAHESKEVKSNVSMNESCSLGTGTMTTETSFSSSANSESTESKLKNKEESGEASPIDDDLNELFLEYLWKTGSIISLDKYMDEMDKTHENAIHK